MPWGCITFLPDGTKGNSGPATLAPIVNGAYQTKAGEGTIGGPHVVLIDAFEAVTLSPGGKGADGHPAPKQRFGKPLFEQVRVQVNLPRQAATHDFALPAE